MNYLKYFQELYELAVWTKMLHMSFSSSHNSENSVHLVYKPQECCKIYL